MLCCILTEEECQDNGDVVGRGSAYVRQCRYTYAHDECWKTQISFLHLQGN